jgi:predicted DNA-binding transcriptional regulator AlpA
MVTRGSQLGCRAPCGRSRGQYLSISRSLFLKLVEEEVLPKPTKVPGHDVTTWDRFDLDAAYEDWKTNREPGENTVHRRLRELDEQRRKNGPV